MTLLLAHLDTHRHPEATNFLAHQRLSDRALLNQALEIMDVISKTNKDVITKKSADLLRRLLDIEADAADGKSSYSTRGATDDANFRNNGTNPEGSLSIHIPYLGVVNIARERSITRASSLGNVAPQSNETPRGSQIQPFPTGSYLFPPITHASVVNKQLPDDLTTHNPPPPVDPPKLETGHTSFLPISSGCELLQAQCPSLSNSANIVLQSDMEFPPLAAGVDAWNFQGVDTAFFDALMRGTSSEETADFGHQWIEDPS
jgi:hypothetical protein